MILYNKLLLPLVGFTINTTISVNQVKSNRNVAGWNEMSSTHRNKIVWHWPEQAEDAEAAHIPPSIL